MTLRVGDVLCSEVECVCGARLVADCVLSVGDMFDCPECSRLVLIQEVRSGLPDGYVKEGEG